MARARSGVETVPTGARHATSVILIDVSSPRIVVALISTLLASLALSASADAATSKRCNVIPRADIGAPVGVSGLKVKSAAAGYPAQAGGKGTLAVCIFSGARGRVVATMGVVKITSGSPRKEMAALLKLARDARVKPKRLRGPWDEAYYLGADGLLLRKGRGIVTLTYSVGASKVDAADMARLARTAARKL